MASTGRVSHWLASSLCIAAALLLAGCYAGSAAAVFGILEVLDEDNSRVNTPPIVTRVEAVRVGKGDLVRVDYELFDDDGGPLDISVRWWEVDEHGIPGLLYEATEFTGCLDADYRPVACREDSIRSDGTTALETAKNEVRRALFIWRARDDLFEKLGEESAYVYLEITATEEGGRKGSRTTEESFPAGNKRPRILSIEPSGESGIIRFDITIVDSTSDPICLSARLCEPAEGQDPELLLDPRSHERCSGLVPLDSFPLEEGGMKSGVFWDSSVLGSVADPAVRLVFTVRDSFDASGDYTMVLGIDNNSDPIVDILIGSGDRSFGVPLRFVVEDGDSHPVNVLFQWAPQGEPFPDLESTLNVDLDYLPGPDLDRLRALVRRGATEDAGCMDLESCREALHILSQAPPRVIRSHLDHCDELQYDELKYNRICVSDLVRRGLVFSPPGQDGSTALEGDSGRLFLIGRRILFPSVGVTGTIVAFDVATSIATLSGTDIDALQAPLPPGTPYELEASRRLLELPSSKEGLVHSFVWDSTADIPADIANSTVWIRAIAFDCTQGTLSPAVDLDLESSPFEEIPAEDDLIDMTLGEINGDEYTDVAVLSGTSFHVFLRSSEPGDFSHEPNLTKLSPRNISIAVGDLNSDGTGDVVLAGEDGVVVHLLDFEDGPEWILTIKSEWILRTAPGPHRVTTGDLNGDGRPEVVVLGQATVELFFQFQGSVGQPVVGELDTYRPNLTIPTDPGPASMALGDVAESDGGEITVTHPDLGTLSIYPRPFRESDRVTITGLGAPSAVATGDVNADGEKDLIVTNAGSNAVSVFFHLNLDALEPGTTSISPDITLETDINPIALGVADISGDGNDDVAVLNSDPDPRNSGSNTITIYEQRDLGASVGGRRRPSAEIKTLNDPLAMALGDFDGDGRSDFLVSHAESSETRLYLQKGTLPAVPTRVLTEKLDVPSAVAIGDVSSDGQNDIVVLNRGDSTMSVFVPNVFGRLPGTPVKIPGLGDRPSGVALGDLNGDGRNDIAVVDGRGSKEIPGAVRVFYQNLRGDLPLAPDRIMTLPGRPAAVAIDDMSGDGRHDLVVATSEEVSVFLQTGSRSLTEEPSLKIEPPFALAALAVGDLSGDGLKDVVVADPGVQEIAVFLQDPGPLFPPEPVLMSTGDNPAARIVLAIAEINGDGLNDLVVVSKSIFIFFQNPRGEGPRLPLSPSQTLDVLESTAIWGAIEDVNGDGADDLLVATLGLLHLYVKTPAGDLPGFPTRVLPIGSPTSFAVADVNGDSRNDLVVTPSDGETVRLYLAR